MSLKYDEHVMVDVAPHARAGRVVGLTVEDGLVTDVEVRMDDNGVTLRVDRGQVRPMLLPASEPRTWRFAYGCEPAGLGRVMLGAEVAPVLVDDEGKVRIAWCRVEVVLTEVEE